MTGCETVVQTQPPPSPVSSAPVVVTEGPRRITMNIDARDYEEIAARVYNSLVASKRIEAGKVVALGPVSQDTDIGYRFNARTFQEKIQVLGLRSGLLEFSFAVDALGGKDAAVERFKIMDLQWEKESTVDPEELRTFGTLANIDYLLFGRLSTDTANNETVFRYNWKLGNCKTGTLVWADEFEMTKVRQ
jgi:hypothetical protein